jgi:hypothetical protein
MAKVGPSTGYGPGDQDEVDKIEAIVGSGGLQVGDSGTAQAGVSSVFDPGGATIRALRPYMKITAGGLGLLVLGVALVYAAGKNTPVGGAIEGAAGGAVAGPGGAAAGAATGAASKLPSGVRRGASGARTGSDEGELSDDEFEVARRVSEGVGEDEARRSVRGEQQAARRAKVLPRLEGAGRPRRTPIKGRGAA